MPARPRPNEKEIPTPDFKSLRALDRYRSLCLWLPVTVGGSSLPWGYTQDPNNPKMCLPDEKALKCFIQGAEYLKQHSYFTVSQWFTSCGFKVGPDGLKKIITDRPVWPELSLPLEERMKL